MPFGELEDSTLEDSTLEDAAVEQVGGALPLPICPLSPDRAGAVVRAVSHQPLDGVELHESVVVVQVGGNRGFRRRLMELGFVPGTQVRVRNVAPLGDPLELELRGCRVSIRRAEARGITVRSAISAD